LPLPIVHILVTLWIVQARPDARAAPRPEPARAGGTAAAPPLDAARDHYDNGERLFKSGVPDQALVEFRLAWEKSRNLAALFGMAQAEYHLGRVKDARAHFQQYLDSPERSEEFAELARLRIKAIDQRLSTVFITTEPAGAHVTLAPLGAQGAGASGEAPNRFEVPQGRYRVSVSHKNYVPQHQELALDVGDTRQLFFQLAPTPARLEIRTHPPNATLYVRGNRARNPYIQDVAPGSYEIYAEATDYEARTDVVSVVPGEQRVVDFRLPYVQRSGRPELIGFWTAAGALAGGTAVVARLNTDPNAASVTASAAVVVAGGAVGGIAGGLLGTALVPDYIRDNRAIFRIAAMWVGAVEGGLAGLTLSSSFLGTWIGGAGGLVAGTAAGPWLDRVAPTYGRVTLVHSAAAAGALAGALSVAAFGRELGLDQKRHTAPAVLIGLNLGLGAGLAMAYLPDQSRYGPSWQRVLLVDLGGAAGALAGALIDTVGQCLREPRSDNECRFEESARTPKLALLGGAVGFAAAWLLTRGYDAGEEPKRAQAARRRGRLLPVPTAIAVPDGGRAVKLVPAVGAHGRF
jgi:hypothetical protein